VRPDAVVVNVGMPGGQLPLVSVHTRAASRLAAEAASSVLGAGARREESA
jgi:beta-N-acetylhexosaminidase